MSPTSRVGFEFSFSTAKSARPSVAGKRLRLLFIANFAGEALPPFLVKKVDVDNLDALITAFSPHVDVALPGETVTSLSFTSLDDFHPDELLRRVPALVHLVQTREQLQNPQTFARAAARLLDGKENNAEGEGGRPGATAPPQSSLFASLLGAAPEGRTHAPAPTPSGLEAVISRAVAPHIVPAPLPQQQTLVTAVEERIGEGLRSVLALPAFASVEAAWRGLERVMHASSGDTDVELWVAAAPPSALLCATAQADLSSSLLASLFLGDDVPPWSLVILDHAFGSTADDLMSLAALGAVAGRAGVCVVATGDAALAAVTAGDTQELWKSLRESPLGPHVALVHPRFLLRLPYGPRRNEVHALPFDELGTSGQPRASRLLWGGGAWAVAAVLARAFTEDPNDLPLGASAEIDDVPALVFVDANGDKQLYPSCEMWLSEARANEVLNAGLIPLVANRNLAKASLLRLQSIASPPQPLALRKV